MNFNHLRCELTLFWWLTLFSIAKRSDSIRSPDGPDSDRPIHKPDSINKGCDEHSGSCAAIDRPCVWRSPQGLVYDLHDFALRQYQFGLTSPKNAFLKFQLCNHPESTIACKNGKKSPACITLPGVPPSSTGEDPRVEELEPNIPNMGINLVYDNGDICEVTNAPRKTIIKLPCGEDSGGSSTDRQASFIHPLKAHEGKKNEICHYFVEFPPSKYGCPVELEWETSESGWPPFFEIANSRRSSDKPDYVAYLPPQSQPPPSPPPPPPPPPQILSVTGCHDSVPAKTTKDCHYAGQVKLVTYGKNFNDRNLQIPECTHSRGRSVFETEACQKSFRERVRVFVGEVECMSVKLVSFFQINCTLVDGAGMDQDVTVKVKTGSSDDWTVLVKFSGAVSFKEKINFRERFSKFVEFGVGGLKKEIDELYRRAFASRGTSPELLKQLGISHVKGILLYGPPGSGKTLLARTIGKILGTSQVSLINAPEVISKYLGESERNLRSHFKTAQEHWEQYGPLSDLFVVIIDEIDAICKPRGKSDQSSASVAYDALVNQLLTLMDGLNEVHNTLVLGLTNRKELLDSALLRPGRFEIQIEVNLPDEEGRWEIFEIHTREMKKNNLLGSNVNLWELAANTSRFSGAEIAGAVRAASSYALERHQKQLDPDSSVPVGGDQFVPSSVLVTSQDFSRAIASISPAYTQSKSEVSANFMPLGYLPCGEAHNLVMDSALDVVHVFLASPVTSVQSLLLYGPRGSGKTTLAVHLATMGKFSFVKVVTASLLTRRHDSLKADAMHEIFEEAYKSETAVIVLDDLMRLVEMVAVGQQLHVSHHLLHVLTTHLTSTPPPGAKLLVIGTITLPSETSLDEPSALGFPDLFNRREYVSLMQTNDIKTFIHARNIHRFEGGQFVLPGNLELPVRQVLLAVDCACARSEVACSVTPPYQTSRIREQHLLDCIMGVVNK